MGDGPPRLEDGLSAAIALGDGGLASATTFGRLTGAVESVEGENADEVIGWVEEHIGFEVIYALAPLEPSECAPPADDGATDLYSLRSRFGSPDAAEEEVSEPEAVSWMPASDRLLGTVQIEWTSAWSPNPQLMEFGDAEEEVPAMKFHLERGFSKDELAEPPFIEMGAYEALWDMPGASFPSIARTVRTKRKALAELVSPGTALDYAIKSTGVIFGNRDVDGFGVSMPMDPNYPAQLHDMRNRLEMLWRRGDWSMAGKGSKVAVIGSRNASGGGTREAHRMAAGLAEAGIIVVSGLARGIDAAAHRGAIDASGRTVAVIGTPICESYPAENGDLQEEIARDHLLVSQVPVIHHMKRHFSMNAHFFPSRNVTMSAISDATVIVEAGGEVGNGAPGKGGPRAGPRPLHHGPVLPAQMAGQFRREGGGPRGRSAGGDRRRAEEGVRRQGGGRAVRMRIPVAAGNPSAPFSDF